MKQYKYIFVTGAPGSRMSEYVEEHIYPLPNIDPSDRSPERTYWAHGELLHRGAYFDPCMEFENDALQWDKPFMERGGSTGYPRSKFNFGDGIRVIKSHTFAFQLDYLEQFKYPIHIVIRPDDECYEWWHAEGGWDITYPEYRRYYIDNDNLKEQIAIQNKTSLEWIEKKRLKKHNDGKRDYYIWTPANEK